MTRRRWIADEISGDRAALIGSHADHLARVLRARIGQEFDIVAGTDVRRGKIIAVSAERVEFDLGEMIPINAAPKITLAMSIFKFDRMEWAVEKCTELGVARIVPIIASRTESHLAAASFKRKERWERIAHQSAEQSRRLAPPEINAPMKLKEVVELTGSLRILLSEVEQETMLREVLEANSNTDDTIIALGPEGGWTPAELDMFDHAGWIPASLGGTILRAETAAIAALAISLSILI